MTSEQKELNRQQLNQCFTALGKRANELGEKNIGCVSFALAASIKDNSDYEFAMWAVHFANHRINEIKKSLEKTEGSS